MASQKWPFSETLSMELVILAHTWDFSLNLSHHMCTTSVSGPARRESNVESGGRQRDFCKGGWPRWDFHFCKGEGGPCDVR